MSYYPTRLSPEARVSLVVRLRERGEADAANEILALESYVHYLRGEMKRLRQILHSTQDESRTVIAKLLEDRDKGP